MRFVGRTADLDDLSRAWAEACAGEPRLVVLRGAPGIGKTMLLNEFVSKVDRATVLYGAGQENSSIPYLSIGAALRPLWRTDLSPFDRYVRAHSSATPLTPSELRLDLILEIAGELLGRARQERVLLAIDDAHWADSATVELLGHVLQSVSIEREPLTLMVVLALRPVGGEVPAAGLVERVRRDPSTVFRDVAGLDLIEVDELVRVLTGHRPSRPLLRALHEASSGNPLLVRSLLERLDAFGGIALRGDSLVQTSSAELVASPRDLDQLLRDRVSNVTDACRRMLVVAAFVGDGAELSTLEALSGLSRERFDAAIDEAQQAALLDTDDEHYRFDHPQLRQVLYQSLRGRRRSDLHIRIADHLEASLAADDPMGAIAVAHHLRHARASVDPQRLERWAGSAARAATEIGAWAEAADLYEAAIEAMAVTAPGATASHALLESRAALAHWYNHDNGKARAHAELAARLAKELGDLDLWAGALEVIARTIWAGVRMSGEEFSDNLWRFDEFIASAGTLRSLSVAKVHWLAGTLRLESNLSAGREHLATAHVLSEEFKDDGFSADLALSEGGAAMTAAEFEDAVDHFSRSEDFALRAVDPLRRAAAVSRRAMTERMLAHLGTAEEDALAASAETRRSGLWAEYALAEALLCGVAAAQGNTAVAIDHGETARRFTEWSEFGQAAMQVYPALAWAYALENRPDDARDALDGLANFDPRLERIFRPLLHAVTGDRERGVRSLRAARRVALSSPLLSSYMYAVQVEVADQLDVDVDLTDAAAMLTAMSDIGLCFLPGWPLFVPRIAAVAVERTGDRLTAGHLRRQAATLAARAGAQHELARLS